MQNSHVEHIFTTDQQMERCNEHIYIEEYTWCSFPPYMHGSAVTYSHQVVLLPLAPDTHLAALSTYEDNTNIQWFTVQYSNLQLMDQIILRSRTCTGYLIYWCCGDRCERWSCWRRRRCEVSGW
jgi:hypothetical protein